MRRLVAVWSILIATTVVVVAQQSTPSERRVALNEPAVALDPQGLSALEATLGTTSLSGSPEAQVTNIRLTIKNTSSIAYSFVSGIVTFYDSASLRCGEGIFKAEALAVGETFETDSPGIRISCTPVNWRIVASNLIPKSTSVITTSPAEARPITNLIITVDGEAHPIQLDKPIVLNFGDRRRTIVVREKP